MKRFALRVCLLALLMGIGLSVGSLSVSAQSVGEEQATLPPVLEASALPFSSSVTDLSYRTYYYDQLGEDSKWIYDALVDADHLELLQRGEWVLVGTPLEINIPQTPTQEEYNACVASIGEAQTLLGGKLQWVTDAVAALDRDRSDLFWTSGVMAKIEILEDGVPVQSSFPIGGGKTYTVFLAVSLPLCEEWDGDGVGDRSLSEDIALLDQNLVAVIEGARNAANYRYGQLQYVNQQLTKYNAYNTPAANGQLQSGYHAPWTPLSALDQLHSANDAAAGSLLPVCEGYARAFKLICDGLGIPSVLVSGTGDGGPHMWNYVQMENGVWYAVDVTWNDSAASNRYFLVGSEVMEQKHVPSSLVMSLGQTVNFSYPTLAATAYEFIRPHEWSVNRLEDKTLTWGDSAALPQISCTTGGEMIWSTDDPSVAYVDARGSLIVAGVGTTRLTVTAKANAEYSASSLSFVLTVCPKALTLTGLSALDRAYDGTTAVALSGGALQGVVSGDEVLVTIPATGEIDSPNASDTPYAVRIPTLVLTGADASNYTLKQPDPIPVRISKAKVTVKVIDQTVKVGDGFPDDPVLAPNVHYTVSGFVGSDFLTRIGLEYMDNGQKIYAFKTPGVFDIVIDVAEASENYEIVTVNGKITVLQHEHIGSWIDKDGEGHTRCCEYCQLEEVAPHRYGAWKTVKAAALGVAGEENRVCEDCGRQETRPIPALKVEQTQPSTKEEPKDGSGSEILNLENLLQEPLVLAIGGGVALLLLLSIIVAIAKRKR